MEHPFDEYRLVENECPACGIILGLLITFSILAVICGYLYK